jgi:hypothetical protein
VLFGSHVQLLGLFVLHRRAHPASNPHPSTDHQPSHAPLDVNQQTVDDPPPPSRPVFIMIRTEDELNRNVE